MFTKYRRRTFLLSMQYSLNDIFNLESLLRPLQDVKTITGAITLFVYYAHDYSSVICMLQ